MSRVAPSLPPPPLPDRPLRHGVESELLTYEKRTTLLSLHLVLRRSQELREITQMARLP